jgi:hypothetical protein
MDGLRYNASASCGLAIISAGAPRSGSTAQHSFIQRAVGELRPLRPEITGFWNWHLKANWPQAKAEAHVANTNRRLRATTGENVVIYKSHSFNRELAQLCGRQLVFTMRRDVFSLALSLGRTWGVRDQHVVSYISSAFSNYACWAAQPEGKHLREQTVHAHLLADPVGVYHRYLRLIERAFIESGIPYTNRAGKIIALHAEADRIGALASALSQEMNRAIKASSRSAAAQSHVAHTQAELALKAKEALPKATARALECVFGEYGTPRTKAEVPRRAGVKGAHAFF